MLDSRLKELTTNMATYADGRDAMVIQLQADSRQLRTDTELEFNNLKKFQKLLLETKMIHR